jgi:hypothetical protein
MPIGDLESVILDRVPKFLRGPNIGRLLKTFAVALDGNLEQLRQGLTFGNPLLCPDYCLPVIAKDRSLRIPPSMPTEAVRVMLSQWIQLHRTRGHPAGVIRYVRNYFAPGPYPSIQMVHDNGTTTTWHKVNSANRYTKTAVASNFPYTGAGAATWGEWYIIIEDEDDDGEPIPAFAFDDDTWDGSDTWDDDETMWDGLAEQCAIDLADMAIDWKRAGTRLGAVILNRTPGSIGPTTSLTTDAEGWTTLPSAGNWLSPVYTSGPNIGLGTRPPYLDWIYDRVYA